MAKIILITHQKGGVGKSTLTFNLAQNLSEHSKVAILDIDAQGSLSQLAKIVDSFEITTDENILTTNDHLDFIFVDTPPYLSSKLKELIKIADLLLVPTKAGILDLLAIDNTISLIKDELKENKTMIILNMIKANTTITEDILKNLDSHKIKIAQTMISDLVAFTRSPLLKGVTADRNAQRQIDSLTKEVLTALI
ncbi:MULTISPECIES: ParA family protein [Maribacter]|uniref:Plasmid segregation oscillating ATPase ParF n=2 Tax=Maribacter TaxID=252356 RepID=A0A1H4NQE0_9FLAO|nr:MULTISPECIES: ParA family protein [Maribacter]SEB97461.1 plasmid segregation oscillating ATPase ParF [Maribacter dokdonensis]VXB83301.1 Plasmid segregation oscillating ATPase ParF [Maribacter litoralis]